MSTLSTHVLDTSRGTPAAGIAVTLERRDGGGWQRLGTGTTDADGRLTSLLPPGVALVDGTYRLDFDVAGYFAAAGVAAFFPSVSITFAVSDRRHHHVPLLLAPFGYSTYRGS